MKFLEPYSAHLLSMLRIMSGLLFLQHGTTKYLNFPVSSFSKASTFTMSGVSSLRRLRNNSDSIHPTGSASDAPFAWAKPTIFITQSGENG